jgi:hypothetical protein
MEQILLALGAAGAALLFIAIAVALWEHRRHLVEMRQQLAWSENTHDLLQAHARDVDARLARLSASVEAHRPGTGTSAGAATPPSASGAAAATHYDDGQTQPRTTAHAGTAAAAMAAAQAAITQQWIDTEPMVLSPPEITASAQPAHAMQVPDFDPTLPIEMSTH